MSLLRMILNGLGMMALIPPVAVAVSSLSAHGHRWPDIVGQFAGPALAATAILTLAFLLMRLWPATAGGVIVTGLLALAVAPQWFPPRPASTGQPLTVYSANLYAPNADVAAMRRSIEAADADVLVLIEFGDAPAAEIDRVLAGYPHRAIATRANRNGGPRSVIASRWPLERLPNDTGEIETGVARVAAPGGPVTVMAVHLTRPWPYQFQWAQIIQAQKMLERRAAIEGPVIVAGDFNSTSAARIGRLIRSEGGLVAAPGFPGTWPSSMPALFGMTIDQVYHSPDLVAVDRRLGRPTGSDHRPVVTTFRRAA